MSGWLAVYRAVRGVRVRSGDHGRLTVDCAGTLDIPTPLEKMGMPF